MKYWVFAYSYHVDRIMKTGGGFTYGRHDRPIREQMGKNPSNWKLAFPELALKHLIKGRCIDEEKLIKKCVSKQEFPLITNWLSNFLWN